nr:hypothetical protein [Candidatus Freyarchaeota archaeon]
MIGSEVLLSWILISLLYDCIMIVIAVFLVFLGLKVAMTFLAAEETKTALVPPQAQPPERANPYVQIARALEEGDKAALVWLMSQKTPRSKLFRALNFAAVDLFLGITSLLSVLSVYIKIRALPVQDWIVILMAMAALILVGLSYWRVKD